MDSLDLFNLDVDIDFETAYRMLSDFDSFNNQITTVTNSNTNNNLLEHRTEYIQPVQQHVIADHLKNILPTNRMNSSISNTKMTPTMSILGKTVHSSLSPSPLGNFNPKTEENLHLNEKTLFNNIYSLPSESIHSSKLTNRYDVQSHDPPNSTAFNQSIPVTQKYHTSTPNLSHNRNHNSIISTKAPQKSTSPYNYKATSDSQIKDLNHQDILLHNHLSSQGIGDELLSACEANAIEQFLDNLLSNDSSQTVPSNVSVPSSNVKHKHNNYNNEHIKDEPIEKHVQPHNFTQKNDATLISIMDQIAKSSDTVNTTKDSTTSDSEDITTLGINTKDIDTEYIPQPLNIPEITLDLLDFPEHLISKTDSLEFKKWKHVEVEKLRRNQTKKAFDQLVSLQNKYSKPLKKKSKRVAKYHLLTKVKNDIQNLIKANRLLEEIITRESGRIQ